MAAFKHDFIRKDGTVNIDAIQGYQKALDEVYLHIKDETNFDPAKRLISAITLLDRITETSKSLEPVLKLAALQAELELNLKTNLA